MKTGFRLGRVAEAVLVCVSAYAALGLSQSAGAHRKIFRQAKGRLASLSEGSYRRTMRRLQKLGFVSGRREADAIALTPAGRKILGIKGLSGSRAVVPNRREWDGAWRVVAFDTPKRRRRDLIRAGLKAIGFRRIQQSVWVHPSDCREQVASLAASLGADREVRFMVVERLDDDSDARRMFNL